MDSFCRELKTDRNIEPFVDGILQIMNIEEKCNAINIIGQAERDKNDYGIYPTLTHDNYRDFRYKDDKSRNFLRQTIVKELIELPRLDKDDDLDLGKGGAKPRTEVRSEKKAFYIIGPPASGKSSISNKIADEVGAYILDSDYVKRKLPEFKNHSASLVHLESDALVFNYNGLGGNLIEYCIKNSYNIVIPKIGHELNKIIDFCETLKKLEYTVYLISVDLDRAKATQRAYNRFIETKRYVPLALIFDGYSNEPSLNYYRIKQSENDVFSGYAQISTDVPVNQPFQLKEEVKLEFLNDLFGGEINEKRIS